MDIIICYISAFFIGIILGLMGGGGSIITVPLLVYIMLLNPITATSYSLFIVGTTSAFGALQNSLKNNISIKTGLIFAVPSFISIYLTRRYIVPAIPDNIIEFKQFTLQKDTFIMSVFAIIMFFAAMAMLRKKRKKNIIKKRYTLVIIQIFVIGILMGLVGAGGGFLIIPTLIFFAGLPMKKAVGTSLFIIAINSLTGFLGDIQNIDIDWYFLLSFSLISIFGIFVGTFLQKFINENQLKKGFGWFILLMAFFIMFEEIIGF